MGKKLDKMRQAAGLPPLKVDGQHREAARVRTAAQRDVRLRKKGRLPDGANVQATWLEGRGVWVGKMTVPVVNGETFTKEFHHEADGLFRLLEELDAKYRAWLKEKSQPLTLPGGDDR